MVLTGTRRQNWLASKSTVASHVHQRISPSADFGPMGNRLLTKQLSNSGLVENWKDKTFTAAQEAAAPVVGGLDDDHAFAKKPKSAKTLPAQAPGKIKVPKNLERELTRQNEVRHL